MTHLAALAATALVNSVWQSALAALLTAALLRLLPGISAAARSTLWSANFVFAVALHFAGTRGISPSHHASPWLALLIAAVWLSLSVWRAAKLLAAAVTLRQMAARAIPVQFGLHVGRFRRPATLSLSIEVDRPCVLGFFRPLVVLPPRLYASLTPAELRQVVLHETGHLFRADDWTNLLQKFVLVAFPLHPVLLWVERRLCRERELACDERVLALTGAPKSYAKCLLSLAERCQPGRTLSLALAAWQRRSELAIRIDAMLRHPARPSSPVQSAGLAALVLAVLAGGTHILSGTPPLLSFVPAAEPLVATHLPASVYRPQLASGRTNTSTPQFLPAVAIVNGPARPAFAPAVLRPRAQISSPHALPLRRARVHGRNLLVSASATRLRWQEVHAAVHRSKRSATPLSPAQTLVSPTLYAPPIFLRTAFYAIRFDDGWLLVQL